MKPTNVNPAIDPQQSASVSASAGTGKTYLLISRIVRLLLDGARPDGILAITFTRKAANEMQARLRERLAGYASATDAALRKQLKAIGVYASPDAMREARGLYERLLMNEHPLRAMTFHAFCQDILGRFPLEANIAPGFELLENDAQLRTEALEVLLSDITRQPADAADREHLQHLLHLIGGVAGVRGALKEFLQRRQDWWAYIEGVEEPLIMAEQQLRQQLKFAEVAEIDNPLKELLADSGVMQAANIVSAMDRMHVRDAKRDLLHRLADTTAPLSVRLGGLEGFCLTLGGNYRQKSFFPKDFLQQQDKKTRARLERWALAVVDKFRVAHGQKLRHDTYVRTVAWQALGHRLIEIYQRLKAAQRCLDFADLEWLTYRLLQDDERARWVQYKVDQRIDHLLIDEFQDTNPTQWQLVLPLLQELATSSDDQRRRTVFLVGDEKQSIYGFRRADSRLLGQASEWLVENVAAAQVELNKSWRSAPLIMRVLNRVFLHSSAAKLTNYPVHDTHRQKLWGRVEVLPLAPAARDPELDSYRNPLIDPTPNFGFANSLEAKQIVDRIEGLVKAKTMVDDPPREMNYGDVLVLLRTRAAAADIENDLRARKIPFFGTERGTLLLSLEVTDVLALFGVLIDPNDNLALAQLLKSPICQCSDDDLTQISALGGAWFGQLQSQDLSDSEPLAIARDNILRWQALASILPAHDLLDRIYKDANVIERYQQAFPASLRQRSRANLERFINLMLEIDSGRYPSLRKIVEHLHALRDAQQDAPDNASLRTTEPRVRIMTTHAAKGLEAPVVILADMHRSRYRDFPWEVLTDWGDRGEEARPQYFMLAPTKARMDVISSDLKEQQMAAAEREEKNLLYVALSRPKQMLIVSGSAGGCGFGDQTWYEVLRDAVLDLGGDVEGANFQGGIVALQDGDAGVSASLTAPQSAFDMDAQPLIEAHLGEPQDPPEIEEGDAELNHEQRLRGLVVHWFLETGLTETAAARQFGLSATDERLLLWQNEAQALLSEPALREWLGLMPGQHVLKEVPISYISKAGNVVSGVIDRLVVSGTEVRVADYKTHRREDETADEAAEEYRQQLMIYSAGLRRMYPRHKVRAAILFTAPPEVVELT